MTEILLKKQRNQINKIIWKNKFKYRNFIKFDGWWG